MEKKEVDQVLTFKTATGEEKSVLVEATEKNNAECLAQYKEKLEAMKNG